MKLNESKLRYIIKNVLSEMKAYHGSGQRFNKFDSSFQGSGEGSNSFGPGHYFTSSKRIGKDYAMEHGTSKLEMPKIIYKGFDDGDCTYQAAQLYRTLDNIIGIKKYDETHENYFWQTLPKLMKTCNSKQEFIHKVYPYLIKVTKAKEDYQNDPDDWYHFALRKALNYLKNNIEENPRSLYQVEIPDGNYADWDTEVPDNWYDFISSEIEKSEHADEMFKNANEFLNSYNERYGKITIGNLYYVLDNMYSDATFGIDLFKATLKKFGYIGIKYPSGTIYQTSSTKDGDMNYTVFDDDNIKITNRWDL